MLPDIAELRPEDAGEVARLLQEHADEPTRQTLWEAEPDAIEQLLRSTPGLSVAARLERQIVGVMLCVAHPTRGYANYLVLAQQHRHADLARALVGRAVTKLASRRRYTCRVDLAAMVDATPFWESVSWGDDAKTAGAASRADAAARAHAATDGDADANAAADADKNPDADADGHADENAVAAAA